MYLGLGKSWFSGFFVCAAVLCLSGASALAAEDFSYTIWNDEVTLTGYSGSGGAVVFPDRIEGFPVTRIGEEAFLEADSLVSVRLGKFVTSIGDEAFRDCGELASVNLGESVKSIGTSAFAYCYALEEVSLPSGLTSLGNSAFGGSGLRSIILPAGVTLIEAYTFSNCYELESVTFGNGVTSIGVDAFSHCHKLAEVVIPSSVISIGDHAFSLCTGLLKVTIGEGLTSIEHSGFAQCSNLAGIYFEGDAPSLGPDVFKFMGGVTRAYYVAGRSGWAESLGGLLTAVWNPFSYTSADGQIEINGYSGAASTVTIPESIEGFPVTGIADEAFRDQPALISIRISDSVVSIGERVFSGCRGLRGIFVNQTHPKFSGMRGVLFDNERTELITFPEGKRGSYWVPEGVTRIGKDAFANCVDLPSVLMREGLESIGENAFRNCVGLSTVTIPASVARIEEGAFSDCLALKSVYFEGDAPVEGGSLFAGVSVGAEAYYLIGATGWANVYGGLPAVAWHPAAGFSEWVAGYGGVGFDDGFASDPDGDRLSNGLENVLGTDPSVASVGLVLVGAYGTSFTFKHPRSTSPADDLEHSYEWTSNLEVYYADGASDEAGTTTVEFSTEKDTPHEGMCTVTATISGAVIPGRLFARMVATETP